MSKVVLLVEDDEDNRDLVSFVIARSRMDVELELAENGQEAIDKALLKPPDLILMDMQMPVMDGWHAVPILKSDDRTKKVPIIAFTAQAKPEDKLRAREIGCDEHYSKPMDPEELIHRVNHILKICIPG